MNYGVQQPESNSWQGQSATALGQGLGRTDLTPAPAPPITVLSLLDQLERLTSDLSEHATSQENLADRIAGAVPTAEVPGAKIAQPPQALTDRLQTLSNDLSRVRSRMQEALGRAHARIG